MCLRVRYQHNNLTAFFIDYLLFFYCTSYSADSSPKHPYTQHFRTHCNTFSFEKIVILLQCISTNGRCFFTPRTMPLTAAWLYASGYRQFCPWATHSNRHSCRESASTKCGQKSQTKSTNSLDSRPKCRHMLTDYSLVKMPTSEPIDWQESDKRCFTFHSLLR